MTAQITSSINTSGVDAYRQGVELTQNKYFYAGVAKIWSGCPGHELPQTTFGQSEKSFYDETPFSDRAGLNPQAFIHAGTFKQNLYSVDLELGTRRYDGVIAPLGMSGSVSSPVGLRGDVQFGDGIDGVLYDRAISSVTSADPFVDGMAKLRRDFTLTGSIGATVFKRPYADNFAASSGLMMPPSASSLHSAMRQMLAPTDLNSRLPFTGKTTSSGFVFDNATYNTDSLAFGGLKF